MFFIMKQEERN